MALKSTVTASVGTTAVSILAKRTNYGTGRRPVAVHNSHASVVLVVGPADVTATTGIKIAAGATLALDLRDSDDLFGIVASSTGSAVVLG